MKFCDESIQKHLLNGGKIKRCNLNTIICINNDKRLSCGRHFNSLYILTKDDLTVDDWTIVELEYNWDKIIEDKILCLFSDNKGFKYNIFSTLRMKDNNLYYTDNGTTYKYCKPFNPEDYKIAKNIKDYEK